MRRFPLALVLVSLLGSMALAAPEGALVIRDDGYYFLPTTGTQLVKIGLVVDQRTDQGPTDPTDPTDPELTERAKQISAFSNIGSEDEAATLASVCQALASQGVTGELAWSAAFRVAITRSSDTAEIPAEWAAWKTKADALAGGEYSSQFFSDVAAGVADAHGIDLSAVKQIASAGFALYKGQPVDIQAIDLGFIGKERITIGELIEIIKIIFELLKELGIFDTVPAGVVTG